jgi:hypothetical protein
MRQDIGHNPEYDAVALSTWGLDPRQSHRMPSPDTVQTTGWIRYYASFPLRVMLLHATPTLYTLFWGSQRRSQYKVVEMHTKSPDWKRVTIIVIIKGVPKGSSHICAQRGPYPHTQHEADQCSGNFHQCQRNCIPCFQLRCVQRGNVSLILLIDIYTVLLACKGAPDYMTIQQQKCPTIVPSQKEAHKGQRSCLVEQTGRIHLPPPLTKKECPSLQSSALFQHSSPTQTKNLLETVTPQQTIPALMLPSPEPQSKQE